MEFQGHSWQFMVEPTSTSEPWMIIGVCEKCGFVKATRVGREHSDQRVDVSGECQGQTRTGYSPSPR